MDESKAQAKYRQASALFARGDHAAALALLNELLAAFPGDARVSQARAQVACAVERERTPEAHAGARRPLKARKMVLRACVAVCLVCLAGTIAWTLTAGRRPEGRAGALTGRSGDAAVTAAAPKTSGARYEPSGKAKGITWIDSPEQFAFSTLTMRLTDGPRGPVANCQVKAYSKDWPLVYPHDGFVKTDAAGSCTLELPRGNWTIVAGGGENYSVPQSGQGIFLVRDVTLPETGALELNTGDGDVTTIRFEDRHGNPADVDDIFLAPSCLVPGCLMPHIGNTAGGRCRVRMDVSKPVSLFMVRRPTPQGEGYFVFLENLRPSREIVCSARDIPLSSVLFLPERIPGLKHPIEWNLWFPLQDFERRYAHTAFRADGPCVAYSNLNFFNLVYWAYWGDEEDWRYESSARGVELNPDSADTVECRASGPLSVGFKILPESPYGSTQFLFNPVQDAFGNTIWWYFPAKSKLKIPINVWRDTAAAPLYSDVFQRHQATGLTAGQVLPASAQFRVDWDVGPWGGRHVIEGRIGDAQYRYEHDIIETDHFTLHAPRGNHEKAQIWAQRLEKVHALYSEFIGVSPGVTEARHFYVNPCGLHAGANGQELFHAGFEAWHPLDPASLQWEACAYHELGHRFQHEYHLQHGHMNPSGEAVEAVGDLFMLLAIDHFHGKTVGDFSRRGLAHPFFDSLRTEGGATYPKHNLRFVMLCYLPTRFGDSINQQFLRKWAESWGLLEPHGYTEEEAAAALYSALAGVNLTWLFNYADWHLDEQRIAEGMHKLEEALPDS